MSKLIGLDNGHGINTGGKRTPNFTDGTKSPLTGKAFMHEWEFNRAVVEYLKIELERCGFRILEISPSSTDMSINDRYKKANDANVDFFLSVHANAIYSYWNSANGIETLVKIKDPSHTPQEKARLEESYRAAKILQAELVAATGLRDRCATMKNKILERDNVGVLNWTKMPAALVECGFMDNDKEARLLLSDSYRKLCAIALAKGICKIFSYDYKGEVKPVTKKTKFPDVPAKHWAEDNIRIATEEGIISGYPDGTFGLGKTLTREEAATIGVNILKAVDARLKK